MNFTNSAFNSGAIQALNGSTDTVVLSGGEALLRAFEAAGGNAAFGIASGKLTPVMQALSRSEVTRFVGVRHEGAASLMAAGSMAGTGRIAMALGELGPGGGNLVSGIASAFSNNLPVFAVTSGNALHISRPSRGSLMDIELQDLFKPITRLSETVFDARRIPELVRLAIRTALVGRPGPVHLNIPADILMQRVAFPVAAFDPAAFALPAPAAPDAAAIDEAIARLKSAQRPLIIGGGGCVLAGMTGELTDLAEALDAAVTTTQMGIGLVASDHERFIGHGGLVGGDAVVRALRDADVVLSLGCRFSSWFWRNGEVMLSPSASLIQVDTDPAQIGRNRHTALGIVADARQTAKALIDSLPSPSRDQRRPWVEDLKKMHDSFLARVSATARNTATPAHPALLVEKTAALLGDDALVVYDGGHTTFWNNDLPVSAPRTRFHEPGLGQLGFGLAYALALQAAYPDKRVINTTGDGSFGFTVQELDTARREGLPVINIIHNNAAWGVIREGQSKQGFEFGTSLEETDYAAIAEGFGCFGARVNHPDGLSTAFAEAVASGLPAVLDCRVAFVPHPMMANFAQSVKAPGESDPLPW